MTNVMQAEDQELLAWRKQGELAVEMIGHRPFQSYTHSQMLADERRLSAYRNAIEALVWDGATVVDIGTGTGILASYAAARTSGSVHALDLDPASTAMAARLCKANGLHNVRVSNKASFGRPIECDPDVIITETLGVIGVDERIVEILYEFCLRYPQVRAIVPSALRVYGVSVRSRAMRDYMDDVVASYMRAGQHGYRFDGELDHIRHALGCSIVSAKFEDAVADEAPQLLAEYQLGKSRTSRFSRSIEVTEGGDGVLLYFVAELGGGQTLATSLNDPPNHWGRAWVLRPNRARALQVSYEPRKTAFDVHWQ